MADTKLEIVVSDGDINATIDAIQSALPEGASILPPAAPAISLADAFQAATAVAGDLPDKFGTWWQAARDADGMDPALSLLIFALVFAIAYGIERGLQALVLKRDDGAAPTENKFSRRFRLALRWAVGRGFLLLLFCALSYVGIALVAGWHSQSAVLATAMFGAILDFRIVRLLIPEFLASPSDPARRLIGLTDSEAQFVMRASTVLLAATAVTNFANDSVVAAVGAGEPTALYAAVMIGLELIMISAYFFVIRRPIARAIRGSLVSGEASLGITTLFANYWHWIYSTLLILGATFRVYDSLTLKEAGASAASGYSIQIFIFAPFAIVALRIWRDERLADLEDKQRGFVVGMFALAEGVVVVLAAVLVLLAWEIDPFSPGEAGIQRMVPGLVSAALTIAVGIAVWHTIFAFLDIYAPEENEEGAEIPDGEGGGSEGSRFKTVYPVLRGFAVATIFTITGLVALSTLGVEIGPLIAGAGVIGLAMGFGAQTLVKDVISGIFYLYEDAFRVGEYISTDEGKGVVEKILVRSVRLRASRGPIYTIPFGSMGTVQNHSRDWVKVKFSIEVDSTQDLERVRKLIKKVGVQLLADPELKDMFLDPLKSQGAIGMVGPNYKIGIKFICRPGEQFLIRRKAYVALQEAIRENDIEIASPRVMVQNQQATAADLAAAASTLPKPEASN